MTDFAARVAEIERQTGRKMQPSAVQSLEWRHRTLEWFMSRLAHPSREDVETSAIMFAAACKKANEEGFLEAVKFCDGLASSHPDRPDLQVISKALHELHERNYGKDTYDAIQRMFEPPPSP